MSTTAQLNQLSPVTSISVPNHEKECVMQEANTEAAVVPSSPFFIGGLAWGLIIILTLLVAHTPTPVPPPLYAGMVYAGVTCFVCLMSFLNDKYNVTFFTAMRVTFLLTAGTMLPFVLSHLMGITFN